MYRCKHVPEQAFTHVCMRGMLHGRMHVSAHARARRCAHELHMHERTHAFPPARAHARKQASTHARTHDRTIARTPARLARTARTGTARTGTSSCNWWAARLRISTRFRIAWISATSQSTERCHSRMLPSQEADASVAPSGEKATEVTGLQWWPLSAESCLPNLRQISQNKPSSVR